MSFRRGQGVALESRSYREFLQETASIIQASGIPFSLFESREYFDELLMHGYIDHHDDLTHFFVGKLSDKPKDAFVEAVVRSLRAGFPDPGLGCFISPIRDEVFQRLGLKSSDLDA